MPVGVGERVRKTSPAQLEKKDSNKAEKEGYMSVYIKVISLPKIPEGAN